MVVLDKLTKTYKQGDTRIFAVNDVSLTVEKGEFVAIVGQSGSGKTTLLNLIGGIDRPTSGRIWIDGKDTSGMDDEQLAKIRRRKIGYIYQDFRLLDVLTAEENIIMPRLLDNKAADKKRLRSLAHFLEIDDRLNHLPRELSGGQRQRVAIARALINNPSILLADEPTGNLDRRAADDIMGLLCQLNRQGCTIILVTHEERYADMCRRRVRFMDGHAQAVVCERY